MPFISFLSENKTNLVIIAFGGAVIAGGVIMYTNNELNRQCDRIYCDQQLNSMRGELAAVRSEVSLLRSMVKSQDLDEQTMVNMNFSELRATAGSDKMVPEHPDVLFRIPSAQSVTSDADYLDACDIFETPAPLYTEKELAETLSQFDALMESKQHDQQAVYDELKKLYEADESLKENAEVLWRLAKACHSLANTFDNKSSKKKALLMEGRSYAKQAYSIDEENFDVIKWLAVMIGSLTDFLGTQDRIEQGYLFKEYLDKAIAMQPGEFSLLHMRGRFAFSVSNLSWFERKAATALFSAPPKASIDEALQDFLKVEELNPNWLENVYYIMQCLLIKKEKSRAVKYMQRALEIIPNDDTEQQINQEVTNLLAKYS